MSFAHPLRQRLVQRRRDRHGLAMLDALLGMAIFGLVCIIGVSGLSQYRARAYATQALSDVRGVSQMTMAYLTTPGVENPMDRLWDVQPATTANWLAAAPITDAEIAMIGARLTGDTRAYWWPTGVQGAGTFRIMTCNDVKVAQFDSSTGQTAEMPGDCSLLDPSVGG